MTIMHGYMAVTAQWLFYNYPMIENYTFLKNESQPLKFLYFRQIVVSAKCLFGEKSVRQTVRSTKCSFDKVSICKMSFGKMFGHPILTLFDTFSISFLATCRSAFLAKKSSFSFRLFLDSSPIGKHFFAAVLLLDFFYPYKIVAGQQHLYMPTAKEQKS